MRKGFLGFRVRSSHVDLGLEAERAEHKLKEAILTHKECSCIL